MRRVSTISLDVDWRAGNRPVFRTLHELSATDRRILHSALFDDSGVGRRWLKKFFPDVVQTLEARSRGLPSDGATAAYRFLEIVDEIGHFDANICPRRSSLCELADLLIQGIDGRSIPEILIAPFLLATLKLAFGTVGVTVELKDETTGGYTRQVRLRNRAGGAMAFPTLYPQKWERAGTDRFIDFTIKIFGANSSSLADRVDIELQSRVHHGDSFRAPHVSAVDNHDTKLTVEDLEKFKALAAMPWPIDPVLIPCGVVNRDPLAASVGVLTHVAHRCHRRWTAAIAEFD